MKKEGKGRLYSLIDNAFQKNKQNKQKKNKFKKGQKVRIRKSI